MLADHIHRLLRLFYINSFESQAEGKRDYIIEFPNTSPEIVFKQLCKLGGFDYQPCSYPKHWSQPILSSRRFQALVEIDDESLPDVMEMMPDMEEAASLGESTEHATEFDDWTTELRRNVGRMTYVKRRREMPCKWGDHCNSASECPYLHSKEERRLFARFPHRRFKFFKTRECKGMDFHTTAEQRKQCGFAHDSEDSWCLDCKM